MEVSKISKYRKLVKEDRILIAQWKNSGYSNIQIAKWLGRNKSTIGRELAGNSFEGRIYEPLHAQHKAEERKVRAWRVGKHPLKNLGIYQYTIDKLREGWSPEQISGRLELEYEDNDSMQICHESIYAFIYSDAPQARNLRLWEYLRRKQARRRVRRGRKSQRVKIPDRVSIHTRSETIEKKVQVGHWEGDSIAGKGHKNGLHTEYERVTSVTKIKRLHRINSKATIRAQTLIFTCLPKELRRSVTLDNGSEMVEHKKLNDKLGIKTYFADPYSSWQRGGNENANLWIRYYFPKGTDFSKVTEEEIQDVEDELNGRPRKRLGFKTPMEVFQEYL